MGVISIAVAERPHQSQTMYELKRRRNVTAVFFYPNTGCKKGISGEEESLLEVQRKQLIGISFVRDLQQHEKVGNS